jgi:hypothetical protein
MIGLAIGHLLWTAFRDRYWEEAFDRLFAQAVALACFWLVSSLRDTPL